MKGIRKLMDLRVTGNLKEDESYNVTNSLLIGDGKPEGKKITYRKGDLIINIGPLMETEPLYICTQSGNPGTWLAVGSVAEGSLIPGPQGPEGPAGPQGPKGDKGDPGINIKGSVPTEQDLDSAGLNIGEGLIAEDTGHMHIWNGQKFVDVGIIQGPQGLQGPVGPAGPKGDQGAVGPQGVEGPRGPEGPKGDMGTFDPNVEFTTLNTEAKTVIGAINELLKLIQSGGGQPEPQPSDAQMYYGYIPYEVSGPLGYEEVTKNLLNRCAATVKAVNVPVVNQPKTTANTETPILDKTSLGMIPEGALVFCAAPVDCHIEFKKDNGIGAQVPFKGDVQTANGVKVDIDGVPYAVYGELLLVNGELFIYANKVN